MTWRALAFDPYAEGNRPVILKNTERKKWKALPKPGESELKVRRCRLTPG
jgi:hypothetical protein